MIPGPFENRKIGSLGLQKTDHVSEDTNQEQAKDDNDRGNVLLQQSHAEEREKKGNEARNQGIQVVLKSGNSCGFKEISACELGNSCVDSFCTGGK